MLPTQQAQTGWPNLRERHSLATISKGRGARSLEFRPIALVDIETIGDYIAQDNPLRAASFVDELQTQCTKIAANPELYRLRAELSSGLRSCAYGRYVIFFRAEVARVLVVRVLHGSRELPTALDEFGELSD